MPKTFPSQLSRSTPVPFGQVAEPATLVDGTRPLTTMPTEGLADFPTFKWPIIGTFAAAVARRAMLTPEDGAHPSVIGAASPIIKAERGKYKNGFIWQPVGALGDPPTPQCYDEKLADGLWTTMESLLKQWDISV